MFSRCDSIHRLRYRFDNIDERFSLATIVTSLLKMKDHLQSLSIIEDDWYSGDIARNFDYSTKIPSLTTFSALRSLELVPQMLDFKVQGGDSDGAGEDFDCRHFPPHLKHLTLTKLELPNIHTYVRRIATSRHARPSLRYVLLDFSGIYGGNMKDRGLHALWCLLRNVGVRLYFRFELNKAIFDSWITLFEEGSGQELRIRASETVLVDKMESYDPYINSSFQITAISYRLDTMPGFVADSTLTWHYHRLLIPSWDHQSHGLQR